MIHLTNRQIHLLKNPYVTRASFSANGVAFDCIDGEWIVRIGTRCIHAITFHEADRTTFEQIIESIFFIKTF